MRTNKLRATLAAALMLGSTAAVMLTGDVASAAGPATPAGSLNLAPAVGGTSGTPFTLSAAAALNCTGSTGANAETFYAVVVPHDTSFVSYTWPGEGGAWPANSRPLEAVTSWSTNLSADSETVGGFVGGDPYTIPPAPQTRFSGDLAGGYYDLVISCVRGAEATRYWTTPITVTDNTPGAGNPFGFSWAPGIVIPEAVPAAPVVTASGSAGTVSASWTAPTANPVVTSYDVTLKQGGTTIGTPQLGVTTLSTTFTGVPNGNGYTVEVAARNTLGLGTAGVSSSFNLVAGAQGAPVLTVAPGANAGELMASWSVPTPLAPNGYNLSVETGGLGGTDISGSPFSVTTGTSRLVTGLTAGTAYTFQVTATYADGSAVATASNVVTASPAGADSLQQVIQVERPAGALILTQRCGVNGALPTLTEDAGFPGFPAAPAIPADQTGAFSPTLVPGGGNDPEFPDYPFASPDVKTQCIVDLGPAQLITTGDLTGQYYSATGALNEVTIVDTRQGDNGWSVTGSIPSLSNGGAGAFDSFSGSLVGWNPVVSDTTDPAGTSTYDQVATPGSAVVPGTTPGLSATLGQPWATAAPGAGLGIAVLDARVNVLIPVANNNGVYSGILTINAA